jgi:hypothetical protein
MAEAGDSMAAGMMSWRRPTPVVKDENMQVF